MASVVDFRSKGILVFDLVTAIMFNISFKVLLRPKSDFFFVLFHISMQAYEHLHMRGTLTRVTLHAKVDTW